MSQSTAAAVDTPAPASNSNVPTGVTPSPAQPAVPPVTVNVGTGGASGPGRARTEGTRDPLHRLDGYSTTSEYLAWAEQVRRDHMRRHDAYLQHAAILEEGIKKTSHWPWALDKLATARRASRPLRQNAGSEQDSARRISASVRALVQLKDAPRARTRGFDPTR